MHRGYKVHVNFEFVLHSIEHSLSVKILLVAAIIKELTCEFNAIVER